MEAEIERGDTVQLDLVGVGIHTGAHGVPVVAFCPAEPFNIRILERGRLAERKQRIPPIITMSNNLVRRLHLQQVPHGFVHLRLVIQARTGIHLCGRVISAERTPGVFVQGNRSFRDYQEMIVMSS